MEVNPAEKEPKTNQAREDIDDKDEANIFPSDFLLEYKIMKNHYFMLSYVIFRTSVE